MKVKMNWKSVRDSGGVWIALVVFLVAAAISNENFRSPQNLVNITRQVSYSGIIALGMTFVIAAGGIDLAVGSLFARAGVVSLFAMNAAGGPESVQLVAGLGAALGVGVIGGALNGVLVGAARVQPFIVTLGTMSIFRSLALYFSNAGLVRTDNTLYQKCGMAEFGGIPLPTILLFVLTACLTVVLKLTRFGRHVCAVGSNERVAYYSAIRTGLVKFWTYVLVGGLELLGGEEAADAASESMVAESGYDKDRNTIDDGATAITDVLGVCVASVGGLGSAVRSLFSRRYDAVPALRELSGRSMRLAVFSNKPDEFAGKVCTHLFGDRFDLIAGNRPGVPVKPDPTGLFLVLERLGLKPEECLYCGDSWVDIDTGKNAGIVTIGAEWGFRGRKELEEHGADYIASQPKELPSIVKAIIASHN